MDELNDIMDEYAAYEYVTGSNNQPSNGDGCFTWFAQIIIAYYVLRILVELFS